MGKPNPSALKNEYHGDLDALAEKFAGWHEEWEELSALQHPLMEKSHEFYHGKQMSDADEAALRDAERPIITINKIAPALDAIYGAVIHNALGFSYVSPHASDGEGPLLPRPDEMMDGAARDIRRGYGADGKDRLTIMDGMIGGLGCQQMRVDDQSSEQLEVVADHIDPFAVGWDTRARESGLVDRRWDFIRRAISDDEFEAEFGIKPEEVEARGRADKNLDTEEDLESHADDPHDVYVWQWYEVEDYKVYVLKPQAAELLAQIGHPLAEKIVRGRVGLTDAEAEEYSDLSDLVAEVSKTRKRRVYWEAKTYGATSPIEVYRIKVNKFTRTFITGKRDRSTGVWYGIVRHAESPQQWANTFFSSIIYTMASGGKGYVAEEGIFVDKDQAQREWSRPDKIKLVTDGALSPTPRFMQIEGNSLPAGLADMATMAVQFVPEVLGATLELRGLQTNNQSGVTEAARADASIGVIGWIFAELREFYRRHGELLLDFIVEFIEPDRLIRMSGPDGRDYYQQFKPPGKDVHYDVVVDDVPSSPNRRRAVFSALASLVPFFQLDPSQIPPGTGIELLRSSPLPGEVVRKLEDNAARPNPEAEKAKALQFETQIAELKKLLGAANELNTQAMLNMAKAKETGQDAETAQRIAATEIEQKKVEGTMDLAIKAQKASLDHAADVRKLEIDGVRQQRALETQMVQQEMKRNEPQPKPGN